MRKILGKIAKKIGKRINKMAEQTATAWTPEDEDIRRASDILEKWSTAVVQKWHDLRKKMDALGLKPPDSLEIKNLALMATDSDELYFIVLGQGILPHEALHNPYFDVSTLGVIRGRIADAFKGYEQKIADAKKYIQDSAAERKQKLRSVLPSIIDEFGADILQYGDLEKHKEVDAGSPPAYSFESGIETGIFRLSTGKRETLEFAEDGIEGIRLTKPGELTTGPTNAETLKLAAGNTGSESPQGNVAPSPSKDFKVTGTTFPDPGAAAPTKQNPNPPPPKNI
ncbi:MAG: hypothetical protein EHM36_00085 [Deltaproteobacteria bacterium]|nr:MAG: hypothetical protein EHM36_00085 [Deltaproteobacteria bacterium]